MPSDHNLFAVGYDSGHVAFFNHVSGKLEHSVQASQSRITSLVASKYASQVVSGDISGHVSVIDQKTKQVTV
jgi:hypothetical protein